MYHNDKLKIIYKFISDVKFDLFCIDDCHVKDSQLLKKLICELSEERFCHSKRFKDCDETICISFIDILLNTIEKLKERTCLNKHYGYLLQLQRLSCILENLKILLCQLKCVTVKDCELLSKTLCLIFKVLEIIQNIISKLNNIECSCESCSCCSDEISECLICMLVEDITELEEKVSDLAHLVLQIASLNIINCTTCTTACCSKPKKRDYLREYCESYYSDCSFCSPKSYSSCSCCNPKSIKFNK